MINPHTDFVNFLFRIPHLLQRSIRNAEAQAKNRVDLEAPSSSAYSSHLQLNREGHASRVRSREAPQQAGLYALQSGEKSFEDRAINVVWRRPSLDS